MPIILVLIALHYFSRSEFRPRLSLCSTFSTLSPTTFQIFPHKQAFTLRFLTCILFSLIKSQQCCSNLLQANGLFFICKGSHQVFVGWRLQQYNYFVLVLNLYINLTKSVIIWLKILTCYAKFEPSYIFSPYSLCLRYNLFVSDLDIYRLSSFCHTSPGDLMSMT